MHGPLTPHLFQQTDPENHPVLSIPRPGANLPGPLPANSHCPAPRVGFQNFTAGGRYAPLGISPGTHQLWEYHKMAGSPGENTFVLWWHYPVSFSATSLVRPQRQGPVSGPPESSTRPGQEHLQIVAAGVPQLARCLIGQSGTLFQVCS